MASGSEGDGAGLNSTEGRPPFADVSLTLWRELAMLTAPTAGQLENVPIAVPRIFLQPLPWATETDCPSVPVCD